jgi:hypothetical protein
MCTLLVTIKLDGCYSYLILLILSIIDQFLKNMNIPAPKVGALQMGSKTQNVNFLKNSYNVFGYISGNYKNRIHK